MESRYACAKWVPSGENSGRDASRGVCLGLSRVDFGPSWCLVHHTNMTSFKRARRDEWASGWSRDMHVPSGFQVEKTRVGDASRGVCLGLSRVDFGPSWCLVHHTSMTSFKRARRDEWASGWSRDMHVPSGFQVEKTRVEMHLVACVWDYRVLISGQVGAWSTTLA